MNIKIVLRLILALSFATLAVIFSELLPPLEGVNSVLLRILLTILAALIGFLVFPEIAAKVTYWTVYSFNFVVNRITNELLSQIMRISKNDSLHLPFITHAPQGNTVVLQKPLILDTSAIIDGRILDIAKTGFLFGTVVVPQFILTELQQVADSSDFLKRSRGRHGFELIEELKKIKSLRIEVWDKDVLGKQVDDKVLQLAKNLHGRIVTTDYNLNRVASVSNVAVLNVNDLANAVKTVAIPGEKLEVKIMHLGKDSTQGVGYLNDGTMIVVQDGAEVVGNTIAIEVTKNIQSPAGRMIFGKVLK